MLGNPLMPGRREKSENGDVASTIVKLPNTLWASALKSWTPYNMIVASQNGNNHVTSGANYTQIQNCYPGLEGADINPKLVS